MRIEVISPYGVSFAITTTDAETLGRWLFETFAKIQPSADTGSCRVMAYPEWSPDGKETDWIGDTRVLSQPMTAMSPREVVAALSAQLDKFDVLTP